MSPFPLSELALSAFAEYIKEIIDKFLNTKGELLQDSHSQELKQFCDRIEEIINVTVPVTLANETSKLLQQCVLSTCSSRKKWFTIAHQILPAVLHNCTTEFVFVLNFNSPTLVQSSKTLEKIESLKSLTTRMYIDTEVIYPLPKLPNFEEPEKWTYIVTRSSLFPSDSMPKQSKIPLYYIDIDDKIIPFIFKFDNLTHLELINSRISYKGISQIMEEFSKKPTGKSMKVIKMKISPSHIILIPKAFPNLTSLEIFLSDAACILPLKELSMLVSLSVGILFNSLGRYDFTTVLGKLLQEVGHQLLKLHITKMKDIDLKLINEKCPCLQNFGLREFDLIPNYNDSVQREPILFPSIKRLELGSHSYPDYFKYLSSRCINVEELVLDHYLDYLYVSFPDMMFRMLENKPNFRCLLIND